MKFLQVTSKYDDNITNNIINIPVDKLAFAYQPTLDSHKSVICIYDAVVEMYDNFRDFARVLEVDHGFKMCRTPEGGECVINPRAIVAWRRHIIGVHHIMFAGKLAVTVNISHINIVELIENL